MLSRTYGQSCPLAQALDRVGDRWTPLIIRDLAAGPRRYSDLAAGLPGIGTTLLADRLKRLVDDGLVAKRNLPPPAASTVYELTPAGVEIVSALVPLAAWGLRYLADVRDDEIRPEWVLMFLQNNFDRERAAGVHDVYEFRVGEHTFHVIIDDGNMTASLGAAPRTPDVVVHSTWTGFVDLGLRRADPVGLANAGEVSFEGDSDVLARCYSLLVRDAPEPVVAAATPSKSRRRRT